MANASDNSAKILRETAIGKVEKVTYKLIMEYIDKINLVKKEIQAVNTALDMVIKTGFEPEISPEMFDAFKCVNNYLLGNREALANRKEQLVFFVLQHLLPTWSESIEDIDCRRDNYQHLTNLVYGGNNKWPTKQA